MADLIVADAGPLIALARLALLDLPSQLGHTVLVPPAVVSECTSNLSRPGARAIRAAFDAGQLVERSPRRQRRPGLPRALGPGELDAILLALEHSAVILLDDLLARRAAIQQGLQVVGVSGLLLAAQQKGLLPEVGPLLKRLQRSGYRLSRRLVQEILRRANEEGSW